MGNFCEKCKSLLRWDFSSGEKAKVCPRCGPVSKNGIPISSIRGPDERNDMDPGGSGRAGAGVPGSTRKFTVRKGVSPRGSKYASRSLYGSNTDSLKSDRMRSMKDWARQKEKDRKAQIDWTKAKDVFPFERIRPGQEEFLEDVKKNIDEGGFLLANVPTGIGKTAASISPAVEDALKNDRTVFFMTSKQSQHQIAVDTLRKLSKRAGISIKAVDIISKQSMCPRDLSRLPHSTFSFLCRQQSKDGTCPLYKQPPPSLTREILTGIKDVEQIVEIASRSRICPHRAALEAAKECSVLICDFNYLFSDLKENILTGLSKDLSDIIVIVDEAHNLPDRIRSHQSNELPVRIIEEAKAASFGGKHIKHYISQILDLILRTAKENMKDEGELELDKRMFLSEIQGLFHGGSLGGSLDIEMFIEMLLDISKKRRSEEEEDPLMLLADFLEGLMRIKRSHILYLTIPDGKGIDSLRIAYRNLDPGEISGPIFKGCHSAVLMSGTLSPPSMFGDILGMAKNRRKEREYPSPFPKRNKLVLIEDGVTTAYKRRGAEMYRKMAERIVSLSGRIPGNVAAFFPSYSILHDVKEYLWGCPKHLIVEERSMSRTEKERILVQLNKARETSGALLLAVMGGSLSEGVDYRDNLLSGVIVVGLPFAPPSLEVQSLRMYFRNKFGYTLGEEYSYIYPAMNKILQAAGRSIRSESDRAVVVLMEERLKQPRYLKFLPDDLRPVRTEGMTLEQAASSFF